MPQDAVDHVRLLNSRNQTQPVTTPRAFEYVEVKRLHQSRQ
jgi:hypothetical protein